MPKTVEVVYENGDRDTVLESDLAQATRAGGKPVTAEALKEEQYGGVEGTVVTAGLAAGRTLTFGGSDYLMSEAGKALAESRGLDGEQARKDVLEGLRLSKEVNPYSDMGGEVLGLLAPVGAGAGIAKLGGMAERAGARVAGSIGGLAARFGAESALIGAQHEITEETLGDHALNGQAIFTEALKDGLLGTAIGGGLGLGGRAASSLLARARGPVADAALDEIAGTPGAGRTLAEHARSTEEMVNEARAAGATRDQASQMASEVTAAAKADDAMGPLEGIVKRTFDGYAERRAAANPELREAMGKLYTDRRALLSRQEEILDTQARAMAERGTKALRGLEDTVNEAQFTTKPTQMAKLVDASRVDLQRDAVATMLQDATKTLDTLESVGIAQREGGLSLKRLRAEVAERAKVNQSLARDSAGRIVKLPERDAYELFISADKLKQAVGRQVPWHLVAPGGDLTERGLFRLTESQQEFAKLYEKLRVGLEDESVWGGAATAQKEWNASFSMAKGRRDDFGRRFSVSIDRVSGASVPEVDSGKVKAMLGQLGGAESDQAVKSTEAFIDGLRARVAAIEKHADLSAGQRARLTEGKAALAEFEKTFQGAQTEAASVARIRALLADENQQSIGGLIGVVSDAVTKPLTTVRRLAEVRNTVKRVEDGVRSGFRKFAKQTEHAAEAPKVRPKEETAKEIARVRELASNPQMLEAQLDRFVGQELRDVAPKTALEVRAAAARSIHWLAKEAPAATVRVGLMGIQGGPRFSDTHIAEWENKRQAALGRIDGQPATEALVDDMRRGRLNRDAIKTIEFVSPALFAHLQSICTEELERMELRGDLDRMPYQQKAAIAAILKVPADGTWTPAFLGMMRSIQLPAQQPMPAAPMQPQGGSRRPIKLNTDIFATEAQAIEQGGAV